MKKIALIGIIAALCMFMSAAVASAGDSHWGAIRGNYEMIATGSCLHSSLGFDPTTASGLQAWTPKAGSTVWGASTLTQGTWTFKRDGNGTLTGINFVIDFPPVGSPDPPFFGSPVARQNAFTDFPFTYMVTHDGVITVQLGSQTLDGMISKDHKTITLGSANQPGKFYYLDENGVYVQYGEVICSSGRVLIRVAD